MLIPQNNPGAAYQARKTEIDDAVHRVLGSGWYILGEEVRAFEQAFAAFLGARYAVGVASGTDALQLALRAVGVGPGDAVLTVSHTAVATATAIVLIGAEPVFVDIGPRGFTLDPNALEETLRRRDHLRLPRAKAVVPVHLYGEPCDMTAISDIAGRWDLRIVEDCAQSHGASWQGRTTGTWSDAAAFSFYPTKNLGALGDGGAVVSSDTALAEHVRMLREYGWRERYVSSVVGDNSRLDELQAAVLRVKLPHLAGGTERRAQIARSYTERLQGLPGLQLPESRPESSPAWHQYVVRAANRDALKADLQAQNIGTIIHYPVPIHRQPAFAHGAGDANLPHTDAAAASVLSLPLFPELTDNEVQVVAEAVRASPNI